MTMQDTTLDGWRPLPWNSPSSSHLLLVSCMPTSSFAVIMKKSSEPFVKGIPLILLSTCVSDVLKQFCEGRISPSPLYMSTRKTTRLILSLETSFLHSTHVSRFVFQSLLTCVLSSSMSIPNITFDDILCSANRFASSDEHHHLSSNNIHTLATSRPNECTAIITPSTHCPPVLASDRVLLWTTPHGIDFQHELESLLPKSTILKMFFVVLHSLDIDTCSNYGVGLLCFTQFCNRISIPENKCMPASHDLLSAFVADTSGTVSDSTVNNWLSGLHYWHIVYGADWHGSSLELLHHMCRGLLWVVPPSSKCARRPPVTLEALTQLHDGLDLCNSFDISVFAIACVAFWCCCR